MRRIAFIGIEHADSEVLTSALLRNLGTDIEVKVFGADAEPAVVAPFLVAKEGGKLDGSSSVVYFSGAADSVLVKKIGRLSKVGVTVREGWDDFNPVADEDAVGHWLAEGTWPEPEPEEDDVDSLLAELLADDEDEDEGDTPVAAPSAAAPAAPEPVDPFTAGFDEGDDLPAGPGAFPSRRFDSMSANEVPAAYARHEDHSESALLTVPKVLTEVEEDDDLPNAFFAAPAAPAAAEEDDDLPLFEPASPASELPALGDEDDDLPLYPGARAAMPSAPAAPAAPDDEDAFGFPSLGAPAAQEPAPAVRELTDPPSWLRGATRARTADTGPAPLPTLAAEEDDDLPLFEPVSAAPELPALGDDDDDLPRFPGFAPAAPEAKSGPESFLDEDDLPDLAPVAPAPAAVAEEDDDLPLFDPAPVLPALGHDDEDDLPRFPGTTTPPYAASQRALRQPAPDDEEDDLPLVSAPSAPAYAAPAPEAAPAASILSDEQDDDDDLPRFPGSSFSATPAVMERAAASLRRRDAASELADEDEGDDLPLPVQRVEAAPARPRAREERGEELSPLGARTTAPAAGEPDEEDAETFEFTFAPKVTTPRYAAPAEKRPDWGMRVTPEADYEDDGLQEAAPEEPRRHRGPEGYEQPVTRADVHDREEATPAEVDLRPAQRVVDRRPAAPVETPAPAPATVPFGGAGLDEDDDFDPDAPAPFMERLAPEARRAQSTMAEIRREYDSRLVNTIRSQTDACVYYVTGSHGGAGKTTSSWMMANTLAAALKKDPERPVFLIEGDYENSKLAQRLNLPPEKNSGRLAEFFRRLYADRSLGKGGVNIAELTEDIIKESVYVNEHGVHIIAAPYDLTRRDGRFLRLAIQKSVEYAARQGGHVFIDADTLSNDDILDRKLASEATHVVLVSFGDPDHVDDTHRAIHTLTTPMLKTVKGSNANGMGVPKDRIKLFFNKTGTERFEDLKQVMLPYLVEGHLPTVGGLNDGGWIGSLTGSDFTYAVTSYAVFLNRIHPMPELRPYQQRTPQKSTARGGFLRGFGRRR